jgi:hypothetical protein
MLAAGCGERTEIVVGVATDLRATAQIDHVRFLASRQGAPLVDTPWDLTEVAGKQPELPGSIGLYSADGSEVSVDVSVRGYLKNNLIVDREATLKLKKGRTLFVRMTLTAECQPGIGPACTAGETCIEGTCQAQPIDSNLLPDYRPELVTKTECDGPLAFVVSSTGAAMEKLGTTCAAGSCHEGVCWK